MKETRSYSFYGDVDIQEVLGGKKFKIFTHDFVFEGVNERHIHTHICAGLKDQHIHTHTHRSPNGKLQEQSWIFNRQSFWTKS